MNTKNQFAQIRKISLTLLVVFGVLFSSFGVGEIQSVRAQGVDTTPTVEVILIPGTVSVNKTIEDVIVLALKNAYSVLTPDIHYFAITDVHEAGNWEFVSVIGFVQFDESVGWFLEDGSWFGVVLLQNDGQGNWIGATEGTIEFSNLLQDVPNHILGPTEKQNIDLSSQSDVSLQSNYIFPWQSGTSMFYGSEGVHSNGFAGVVSGWKAVDMLSDGDTGAGHAPNRLLASETATIDYVCNDGTSVAVRMGNFFYTHLLYNSNLYYGKTFNQGNEMGQMKSGTFSANCGYANQGSNWFHVHWGFPDADLQVGGWTLSMSTQNWTSGNTTVSPGNGWITTTGGGGPSGYTFCTNEGGYCSFSGTADVAFGANGSFNYKYGVTNGINCDNNTFGDPIYGTPKACYYKLTITPPVCSPTADQVAFFVDANHSGTCVVKGIGNYPDSGSMGIPNDSLSSVKVGSNVKLTLYIDSNYTNTSEPFTNDDTNLSDNLIGNDRVSSAKVETRNCPSGSGVRLFDGINCSGSYVDAQIGLAQLEQSSFNFNDRAESIAIPSGWSTRLYLHNSETSASACFNSTDTNLGDNTFSDGTNVANQATWVRVYGNTSCTLVTPPDPPLLSSPSDGQYFNEGDAINLSWSATGSEYYGEVSGGPADTTSFGWQTGTSKNIGSQWAGYEYSWRVKARNSSGESNWSSPWKFVVRPGAPSNLSVSVVSCSQINLSWSDNSGSEEGYKVYRNGSLIATLGSGVMSYQDTRLTGNTSYSYTVKAYRGSIESNSSNTATASTLACQPDLVPYPRSGRQDPVIVSSVTGTTTNDTIYAGQPVYMDWGFKNIGNGNINANYYVDLYIDSQRYVHYPFTSLCAGCTMGFDDWGEGWYIPGWHTVKLVVDPENTIAESNESNNEWSKQFFWTGYDLVVSKTGTGSGTVISNPTGINCGSDCSESYAYNTTVTLTATADTGSTFTGWSGACSGTGSCVVSMTTARSVTATFTTGPTDSLMLDIFGTGSGIVTGPGINCPGDCSESYIHNTSITLIAAPSIGSSFSHWVGDCTGTSPTCTLPMTTGRFVTAFFTANPTNTGLLNPSSNAALKGGDNNGYEVNRINAYANDSVFAMDVNSGNGTSTSCTDGKKDKHLFYNYGISLPGAATIQGIEVQLDAKVDSASGSSKLCVQLSWDGGVSWTTAKSTGTLSTAEQTFILGSPTDTWGHAWTTSQLSNANFRVRIIDVSSSTSSDFSLDWIAVRATYK